MRAKMWFAAAVVSFAACQTRNADYRGDLPAVPAVRDAAMAAPDLAAGAFDAATADDAAVIVDFAAGDLTAYADLTTTADLTAGADLLPPPADLLPAADLAPPSADLTATPP